MTATTPTPTSGTGRAQHDEAAGIRHEIDETYPGRWALLLTPLCAPSRAHKHKDKDGNYIDCETPGKRPITGAWNPKAVARWTTGTGREQHLGEMARHLAGGGNVGLAVPPGVLVLDADTPESVAMLDAILGDAPMQESRPGRAHFVVRVPPDLAIAATVRAEIAPGVAVDLRSAGRSQIACAPSRHHTGTDYTWRRALPETIDELPECPAGILATITTPPTRTRESVGTDGDEIAEGGRNAALTSLAGTMRRRGMAEAAILAALREENTRRCRPPLPDAEVRGIAASVARYAPDGADAAESEQAITRAYSIESGCLTWRKATRDGASPVRLGNFAARIVAEEIRDDGAEQTVQLRIEGTLASGRPLRAASIPAAQFGAMNWTLGAWGAAAIPTAGQGTKDHLRAAIQTLSGEIPQTVIYTCTGWRKIGARWAYLHAGGATGADGPVDGVAVDLSGALVGYVLPAPPEGADLVAAVRASLELLDLGVDGVTVPLLASVARSVIDRADFALHYSGATGVWKSELAALAQSHFGAGFSGRNLPGSWSSTENALEGLAFAAKDALLVVDDFAPRGSTQDIARMHRAAERLIRAAGNASARGRMRADLSLRPPKPPRGLILSTGEDLPPGHSLRARMVIVEVRAGDIDGGRLTRAQEHARRGTFAAALAGFIAWLAAQLEEERERVAEAVLAWRAPGGEHRRTPDTLANLSAGIDAFLRFAVEANAITDAERVALEERAERALLALGEAQAEHLRNEEPTVRFLELLRAAITSGDAHLASARDEGCPCDDGARACGWDVTWTGQGEDATPIPRPHGRRIGWVREALGGWDVYLSPGPAYRVAQEYASRQGWAVATVERTLWRRLAEAGLLAASDDGRNTRTVRIGSRTEKVLHLRLGALLSPGIGNIGNNGNGGPEDAGERSSGSPEADSVPDPVPDNAREREQHREQDRREDAGERSAEALFPMFPLSPILGGERELEREPARAADVERF